MCWKSFEGARIFLGTVYRAGFYLLSYIVYLIDTLPNALGLMPHIKRMENILKHDSWLANGNHNNNFA